MGERKVRCDKQVQIAPTIEVEVYQTIELLAEICDYQDVCNVAEPLVIDAASTHRVVDQLSKYIRSGKIIEFENRFYVGHSPMKYKPLFTGETRRCFMRFSQLHDVRFSDFANAFGCRTATAVGLILKTAVHDRELVLRQIERCVVADLNARPQSQLRQILNGINVATEKEGIRISNQTMARHVAIECMKQRMTIKKVIWSYLD